MYPGIELRTMRYVVAVGNELHFSRAAEKVHVAQPSLSKQIRNVEDELGVPLFRRTRKKVEITEPGRAFIENAQQALLFAERAASMARAASAGQQGKLFLGVSPCVDLKLFFRIRDAFEKHYREVKFHFVTGLAEDQAEKIMRNDLHAGLVELPIRYRGLAVVNLHREPLVMAIPYNDRLTSVGALRPDQLRQKPLVALAREADPASERILTSLHVWGYHPEKVFLVLNLAQAFDFVAAGEAVAVLRASAQRFESRSIVLRSLAELPTVDTGIAYRRDVRSQLVRNLVRLVRKVFAEERARMIGVTKPSAF